MRSTCLMLLACCLFTADLPRAAVPVEKNRDRHELFLKIAKAGDVDLLFLGDSITDWWRTTGKSVWEQYFAPLKAANFGIGGDGTQHVLWRIQNGELEGIHPRLMVLMIGTNNGLDPPEDVALGIKLIIGEIQQRSPGTRILLLGIFPRSERPERWRLFTEKVNAIISAYASPVDPRRVVYLDLADRFLSADRTLSKDIMPDGLHPNLKGYQIWAESIIGTVKQLLQADLEHLVPVILRRATIPKVAKAEETILAGGVVNGRKALERLAADKDAATVEAAKASLEQLAAWRTSMDDTLAKQRSDGDVLAAADLAAAMAKLYGGDEGKAYKEQEAVLRKDPASAAGKEYQRLAALPFAARRDPQFAKAVAAFLKKHPEGYYAEAAKALLP